MQADVKIFRIFPVLDPYVEAPVGVFSRRQRRVEPQVEPQVEVVASPARRRVALGDEMSHGYVVAEHGLAVGKHGLEFEEVFGGRAAVVGGQPEAADVGLHQADVGLGGCARARPFVLLYGVGHGHGIVVRHIGGELSARSHSADASARRPEVADIFGVDGDVECVDDIFGVQGAYHLCAAVGVARVVGHYGVGCEPFGRPSHVAAAVGASAVPFGAFLPRGESLGGVHGVESAEPDVVVFVLGEVEHGGPVASFR